MKTNLRYLILMLFVAFNFLTVFAKMTSTVIKGRVIDEYDKPVEFANAVLISPASGQIVQGEVSDKKGEFTIRKIEHGEYVLSVSMLGYSKFETERIMIDGKSPVIEKTVRLSEHVEKLNDVVITAKKQFIEQQVDKLVINPEASSTTESENVFEILAKLPGVSVDNNDNISLKGLQGVKILIDDKPTYMSAAQLASMLKSMQGKHIDKIEIIENPSARYDAEGNSGIINIKTKHQRAHGFNGAVNGGMNIASKIRWNGSADLNMNYGQFNVYGSLSHYRWAGWQGMEGLRRFTTPDLLGASQTINTRTDYMGNGTNYKVGLDYFLAKNHVISAMFRGNGGSNNNSEDSKSTFINKNQLVDSSLISDAASTNRWNNQTYNLNYKWDIDTIGQSLSVDVDYARFGFNSNYNLNGKFYDANDVELDQAMQVTTDQGNDIHIVTSKIDYILPVNKMINLESGLKSSFVNTDSKISMLGYLTQSDHFIYEENILAAYVNARIQLKKTSFQLGLRLENTISKGNSIATNQLNDTSYLKFFPSFFVQQQLNDKHSVNFKYSYRIGRPGYHSLNPFKWMIDPYTYSVGNPNLKPQFTHSAGLSHNFAGAFITNIGFNYTSGLFTEIIRQDVATKAIFQTMENLNNSIDMNISETVQLKPLEWWRLNGTITGMYKRIAMSAAENESLSRFTLMANMNNYISLPYKIDMEVNARYSGKQLVSNIIVNPRFSLDIGLQKKILDNQGTVKVSVSDVFNTNQNSAYAKYQDVDLEVKNSYDSRRLNLTFSYRFGKDDFKTRANRTTSSSDEQNRSAK